MKKFSFLRSLNQVDLSSGRIQADGATGDTLTLATASGKVEVGSTILSGPLSCTSVSGNVTLGEINVGELTISTTSGKLSVALPEDGGQVSFATVSGRLRTALPYEVVDGLRVFGDGGCAINVVTISGDLELKQGHDV